MCSLVVLAVCGSFHGKLWPFEIYFLRIKALQHKCRRSAGYQVPQPAKDVELRTVCLKSFIQEKKSMTASNLQPSDLRSNTYRSLPGNQDIIYHYLASTLLAFSFTGLLVVTSNSYYCIMHSGRSRNLREFQNSENVSPVLIWKQRGHNLPFQIHWIKFQLQTSRTLAICSLWQFYCQVY